ncbi:hypothetical protein Nhal_0425 [Nitrosococcus halophilus Nc 4]|uniref:Lipoprotein n=1 Tax=Nitrosococcus halophilus (strain Nc4) TaxID=472759 RepID=D5BVI7_NITHN|nr:hypothetical protein [Nitrosococcus halophilus]ADE13615.1 hypothetical protein Nhal_0425 [Nitrosococcus halophilus Nc 4]
MGKFILFCLALFTMGSVWASDDPSPGVEFPELVITYRYENFPSFPSHAQAEAHTPKEGKRVLGSAKIIKLRWRELAEAKILVSFIVEETHFDDKGEVIYRAHSTFSGEGRSMEEEGRKIEEEVLEGRKRLELFSWWPIGSLP